MMAAFQRMLAVMMRNISCKNTHITYNSSVKHFSKTATSYNYETDGKSYVTILNNEPEAPVMINSYSLLGFRLNNGLFAMGPVALFPHSILSWNITGDEDINEKSLSLFLHLAPKLDVLLIGLSDSRNEKLLLEVRRNVYEIMRKVKSDKFNVEVLPTEKAVSTFNFLNSEKRYIGAALIPPTYYTPTADDEYRMEYLTKKKKEGDFLLSE